MNTPLLEIRNLTVEYPASTSRRRALADITLTVSDGEVHGIAGESGAGKSTLAQAILGLLPFHRASWRGEILFRGQNLLTMPERRLRGLRGNRIAMVFQNAINSLDPLCRIGDQIAEVIRAHQDWDRNRIESRVRQVIADVSLPVTEMFLRSFPHQLSGGMAQRVMIAMALANQPDLLVADEPTSSVDVTTQAELLALLRRLREQCGMTIVFISHDLHVLGSIADRLSIVQAGTIVETGKTSDILSHPAHPYTRRLIDALPVAPPIRSTPSHP